MGVAPQLLISTKHFHADARIGDWVDCTFVLDKANCQNLRDFNSPECRFLGVIFLENNCSPFFPSTEMVHEHLSASFALQFFASPYQFNRFFFRGAKTGFLSIHRWYLEK